MEAKLTRLTHKIAIQLYLVAERAAPFAVLAPGSQSGNFWIHLRKLCLHSFLDFQGYRKLCYGQGQESARFLPCKTGKSFLCVLTPCHGVTYFPDGVKACSNAGQDRDFLIANKSSENVGTTVTNQNWIREEIKSRLKSGNVHYHSVQNHFCSGLLSRNFFFFFFFFFLFFLMPFSGIGFFLLLMDPLDIW
jgi:hypothetical protein